MHGTVHWALYLLEDGPEQMGQLVTELREVFQQMRRAGAAGDSEQYQQRLDEIIRRATFAACHASEEEFVGWMMAWHRRSSPRSDRLVANVVTGLESSFGATLTEQEREVLAAVALDREILEQSLSSFLWHANALSLPEYEAGEELVLVAGHADHFMAADFQMKVSRSIDKIVDSLTYRLGLEQHDRRVRLARGLAVIMRRQARDVAAVNVLLMTLEALSRRSWEGDRDLAEWLVGLFRPGKALEQALQEHRAVAEKEERDHLDRTALLGAIAEIEQLEWSKRGLHVADFETAVRHNLRETYLGEAGRVAGEHQELPASDYLEENEAALVDPMSHAGDGHDRDGVPDRVVPYLDKLPPKEREVFIEFCGAVEAGLATPSGKQGDSLRQLWGEDYETKRRALSRALRRLRELDTKA